MTQKTKRFYRFQKTENSSDVTAILKLRNENLADFFKDKKIQRKTDKLSKYLFKIFLNLMCECIFSLNCMVIISVYSNYGLNKLILL